MANWNTIAGFFGGTGRNQIITPTITTATTSAFQVQTDSGAPVTAVLSVPYGSGVIGTSNPLDINANPAITGFNFGAFGGRPNGTNAPWYSTTSFDGSRGFKVRINGTLTSAATVSQTATITLYNGTSTSGSVVGATAAANVAAGGTFGFTVEAHLFWDSTSKIISGWVSTSIGGVSVAPAPVTAITAVNAVSDLNFVAAITTAVAGSVSVDVSEFVIDQV